VTNTKTFVIGLAVLFVLGLSVLTVQPAHAQGTNVNLAKPKGKIKADNKAKPPPTASNGVLIPKLELVNIDNAGPTQQFNIKITNWAKFPPELFKKEPNLPPNPCGQGNLHAPAAFKVIRKADGKTVGCKVVASQEDLQTVSFRTYDGTKPEIYLLLIDLKTNTVYKSKALLTTQK
jgi:hypothetical protein